MLWLHIYVSMFGLAAVLFFSVTGITLNHPDWFFGQRRAPGPGRGPGRPQVAQRRDAGAAGDGAEAAGEPDPSGQVAKLEIVEHLRKTHGVRGALADFRVDERECMVSFKGPGYAADAFIDRESGHYNLTADLSRLHRRDQRPAQGPRHRPGLVGVIDISAVVLTVISLTGLILIFYLKLRRKPGLVVSLIGAAVIVAICLYWVP